MGERILRNCLFVSWIDTEKKKDCSRSLTVMAKTDQRRTGVYLMEEGRRFVSELMHENLGAKISKS